MQRKTEKGRETGRYRNNEGVKEREIDKQQRRNESRQKEGKGQIHKTKTNQETTKGRKQYRQVTNNGKKEKIN